jgi:protease-4
MKQFWITFFGSVTGVVIASIITPIVFFIILAMMVDNALRNADTAETLPRAGIVLELDMREARLDQPSRNPFSFGQPTAIVDLVRALEIAESDNRVSGLFIRANEFGVSPGAAEELRGAIESFQDSGKFVVAHAQGFEGTSVTAYYAVAGVGEIWMQDTSGFAAAGLSAEIPFLGGLFEQFNADAEFVQFYEYKNAANTYTESELTEAHREAATSYMTSIYDSAVSSIASDRDIEEDALRAIFENSPYSAEQAEQAGLVDRLGHVIDARESAIRRVGGGGNVLAMADYAEAALNGWRTGPVIALVEGQGAIVTGGETQSVLDDSQMIGGDAMSASILSAANDPQVRAIVIRVDSPGGSAIASDQIWDTIGRAQEAGKPVVVSMASVAASGGYYIAAPADYVLAHETTLTGSIGVLGGKVNLAETFGMVGLNFETIAVGGEYATAYSGTQSFSETQLEAYRSQMEDVYEDFTERVAEGRDLPLERVLEIARGRVWTGAQAMEIGLVDEIGGLRAAVDAAKELAGIAPDARVQLKRFPQERDPFEAFQELFGVSAQSAQAAARVNALMELPEVRAAMEARRAMDTRGVQMRAYPAQPQ